MRRRNGTVVFVSMNVLLLVAALSVVFCPGASAQSGTTASTSAPSASTQATLPYLDKNLSVEQRVADLLSRMTLEEKVAQLEGSWQNHVFVKDPNVFFTDDKGNFQPDRAALLLKNGLGEMTRPSENKSARATAEFTNTMQKWIKDNTRLGIPVVFHEECLHGYVAPGSTSYPQAIALASTWDTQLVGNIFSATASEVRARGATQCLTPVLDLARDPRWGRTEETYGEDPYLVARMGVAAINGLQGTSWTIDRHHVMATMKHFAAHGQPESGTNTAPANFSERDLRETFLVPFEAAVKEAHVGSAMASYNEIDGIPSHVNPWLLDRVLRQEWGFRGYVTSDGDGLQMLIGTHHVAANKPDAARLALAAGVDYDLSDGSVYRTLLGQVKQGSVPESEIDLAVARVLRTKFRLGLFDNPYVDPDYAEKITNNSEHRQIALKAAQETIVLLKNEKNLLPLDLTKLKTIAVIGPNANDLHLGGYSRLPSHSVPILQGIRDRVGTKAKVVYAQGCQFTAGKQDWHGWFENDSKLVDPATQADKIKEAVDAAKNADVAILVVGENEATNREAWSENHLGDRDSLDLL